MTNGNYLGKKVLGNKNEKYNLMRLIVICSVLLSFNIRASEFIYPYVQKINFTINNGIVFSHGTETLELAVRNQLKYMFGVLNEVDSGIDFPQMKINVISSFENEIHYNLTGVIAWDKNRPLPRSFNFLLPKRGDQIGLNEFLNKYQKTCSRKPSNIGSFWNYYRPLKGWLYNE